MRISLTVDDLDEDGLGCGRHEGATVHVFGALPGDRALVDVEHRSPHAPRAWGRLVALERPSPDRVSPSCPATGRCGGCPLGALRDTAQLAWKATQVAGATHPIVPSPKSLGYRNQSKLVFGRLRGAPTLGAFAPRTHQVVDITGCRVVEPVLEEVRAALLPALEDVTPYDEKTHTGDLAYVLLRSNWRGEVLVTLVGPNVPAISRAVHPAIAGVCANDGPRGNAIFGAATRVLDGAGELEERVGEVQLLLSPTAFFQVNRDVAALIYAAIDAWIAPDARVADLYAGVGGIARTLAARGRPVVAIESNTDAVRDAQRVPSSVRFMAGDAATSPLDIDAIVVNPPRKGLSTELCTALNASRAGQLAYVSCDPRTLARDLGRLGAYTAERIQPYDMHPQTAHVETLALLRRR